MKYFCKEYGYIFKDCSRASSQYVKSKSRGHETDKCNWSRATVQNHDDENQNDEEILDEMKMLEEISYSTRKKEKKK